MTTIYKSENGRTAVLNEYRNILSEWPVKNQQHTIPTSYGNTFVIESGHADKPVLILIHGSVSNSYTWYGDVARLSEKYHLFSVDIIGEAGLSAESRPTYQSGVYPKWLDEVLGGLGIQKCSIAGMSLGGWMALSYAISYPAKVENLLLLCPGGLAYEKRGFVWKALLNKLLGEKGKLRTMENVLGSALSEGTSTSMNRGFAYMLLIGEHFKPRMARLPIFSREELVRLNMPVLLIFGEDDQLIRVEESVKHLQNHAQNVTSIVLPGAGHALLNQAERMISFLNGTG